MSHSIADTAGDPVVSAGNGDAPAKPRFLSLTIGSIGVVYGDIGTSTLYAFREAISAATGSGNPASEPVVLGILSLIIWALLLVVTAKYVLILLRADNKGEGGTLALMALASHSLMISSEGLGFLSLRVIAHSGDHGAAKRLRHLDGDRTDARTACMHQNCFSGFKLGVVEQHVLDGPECNRCTGCVA